MTRSPSISMESVFFFEEAASRCPLFRAEVRINRSFYAVPLAIYNIIC